MENIFTKDTVTLLQAMESFKEPATYLADTFFGQKMPVATSSYVAVEYRKGARKLAPFIVSGSRGALVTRDGSQARLYKAPLVGVRRIISVEELEQRQFGEMPIYSTLTGQERAAQLQATDLRDLSAMIYNRKNKFAADILTAGKTVIKGFADDGETIQTDEIDFNFDGVKTPATLWSNKSAKIYDDILDAVNAIAEESGELPDIMVCGANVEKYLLQNEQVKDFLLVNNRANLTIAGLTPKYLSPQTRYLGTIPALGLEMYSYLESYVEGGEVKKFLPENSVIIAKAGRGRQIHGAVTLIDRNLGAQTYAAEIVPHYSASEVSQTLNLSLYSRFILAPDEVGSWIHIKTCG